MAQKILSYQMKVSDKGLPCKGVLKEIENSLEAKQEFVNGLIQVIMVEDIDIILNDEGKLMGLPPNRAILDDDNILLDVIVGNCLAVRHNEDGEFISINEDDIPTIEKYLRPVICLDGMISLIPEEFLYTLEGGEN